MRLAGQARRGQAGQERSDVGSRTLAARRAAAAGGVLAKSPKEAAMQRFIIEREIPGAGTLEREQLKEAAARSNAALAQLAPDIQWVESYVADDKTFCVYLAKDEALIRKHAEISGFPANRITPIKRLIDPTTAG
jgi:Protein of unknown function (DUF4242)